MNKIVLFILLFAVSACTSTSTLISTDEEFCDWFNKSQEIRTERIPAILIVQDVSDKYSGVPFDFNNTTMMNDYKNAIKEYIAVNEKFIEEWKKLVVQISARDYCSIKAQSEGKGVLV